MLTAEQIKQAAKDGAAEAAAALEERLRTLEVKLEKTPVTANAKGIDQPSAVGHIGTTKAARVTRATEIFVASDRHAGKGLKLGAYLRALGSSHRNGYRKSIAQTLSEWGYMQLADECGAAEKEAEIVFRTLGESTVSAGGALIPPQMAAEIIELLRSKAVIRSMGPTLVPMPNGSISMRKQTGAGSAAYVGESVAATLSTPAVGTVSLVAKKLVAAIVASNEILNDASPEADAFIRDDLVRVLGLREDLAFIRGDGASNTPKGLRTLAVAANVAAATQAGAVATLSEVTQDLEDMQGDLQDDNVDLDSTCFWLMSPRSMRFLRTLRDGVGAYVFKDEIAAGKLFGFKLAISTQVPNILSGATESAGTDSELYFAKASELLLGDTKTLEISFHPDAAYDDSGTVKSGLSRDESSFRAIARHDFGVRHDSAISRRHTVKWGV